MSFNLYKVLFPCDKKFRLARVTPWKIVGGSKSYNLTINMKKKKISNLDNLLMQLMETSKATQHTIKNLEIQFVKLAKEVAKFFVTREYNFVEVEAHEESLVEEHDSREKYDEKSEERTQQQWEKCSQVEIQ